MAFERLFQTGFEFRTGLEFAVGTGNGSPGVHDDNVHTGEWSLNSGSDRCVFYWKRMVDQIRSNWFAFNTGAASGTVVGVYGVKNLQGILIRILYTPGTDTFDLEYDGVVLVNIPAPGAGWETGSWITVGCTCKGGTDGWFSFYLNGDLIYKHEDHIFDDGDIGAVAVGTANYIDDVYVDEATDGEDDNAPPSPRFYPLQAIGNGDSDEWFPEGVVNSVDAIRSITTSVNPRFNAYPPFLYAGAADLKSEWSFPSPATDERIRAIVAYSIMNKGKSEVDTQVRFYAKDGVTVLNGADQSLPTASAVVWQRFALAPDGDAWDYGDLVRCVFGVESRGVF